MAFPVTLLYTSLSGLILVILSVLVIRQRIRDKVVIGDGSAEQLIRCIRAQQNFVEYVPLILILMALLEAANTSIYLLHLLGIATLIGRIFHAYSLIKKEPQSKAQGNMVIKFRQIGMMLTFIVIIIAALYGLVVSVGAW